MTEQRTTPEQRAALRSKYQSRTEYTDWWGRRFYDNHDDVLAVCDDADALAGALAEVARLRARIQDALDTSWGDRGGERSAADALDDVRAVLTSALSREPRGVEG